MRFAVAGLPAPQGDLSGFPIRLAGGKIRVQMVHKNKDELHPWRERVARVAKANLPEGWQLLDGPVQVECIFLLPRPAPGARGSKMATEYPIHQSSGDVDKLARAVQDAMTKVVYTDDCRVIRLIVEKRYPEPTRATGVLVEVKWIPGYPGGVPAGEQEALEV